MRALLAALIVFAATAVSAADLSLVRIRPSYRSAESFERISEYFVKEENGAEQHILRTQPAERAGYYFLVRIKNGGTALVGAKFEVKVISPDATEPTSYTFETAVPAGSTAYNLGITGSDWSGKPKEHSVAWQVRLLSATGEELLRTQSFLWSLPDKK
jgi:hypothetical protein